MAAAGSLVAERYSLGRRIAVGGMGEVWEATDTTLDRKVAVKILKAEYSGEAEFLHRFRTEARTTASLNHPGIAAVHDYGETSSEPDGAPDTAYLVMELVEGEPLAAILARGGRLGADWTLDMLEQAGNALQAAHARGLVHRDVKPGNIMIVYGPGHIGVKLTDFGIAKAAHAAPVTKSGVVMGTAHYIAPEQALGQEAEPASDVYSLAVCGYECLMGHRPFLSDNSVTVAMKHIRELPPPLPPDVPPGARALIDATLVKDPRQRYRTGGEFAAAVAAVRAGYPLPVPSGLAATPPVPPRVPAPQFAPLPSGAFAPVAPPRRRRGLLWALIVVLVVAIVALGVWGVVAAVTTSHNGALAGVRAPLRSEPGMMVAARRGLPGERTPGGDDAGSTNRFGRGSGATVHAAVRPHPVRVRTEQYSRMTGATLTPMSSRATHRRAGRRER